MEKLNITKQNFIKFQSPSLTIFKPNLNSMFSIYNRILGIILFFIILIFLCVCIYTYNYTLNNVYFASHYILFSKFLQLIVYNEFIQLIGLIFVIIAFSYHIVYSSFKIYTKSNKIFQIISSKINIVNDLYLDILKLVLILVLFLNIFFSLNIINYFTFSFISILYFGILVLVK